jgi:hypothetical protein
MTWASRDFYATVPVLDSFARLTDPSVYTPLPDDWVLGLSDVVQSTDAIAQGRYKAVNTAGAALIAAVANAVGSASDVPFAFGGDGASFALPGAAEALARSVMAESAAWVRDELGLSLRTALVPVAAVRAEAGQDVRVARFAPSPGVTYAMFSGGGLACAETWMKEGRFGVEPGPIGARPDLSGLSCRFEEIATQRGVILSLIIVPASPGTSPRTFQALVDAILQLVEADGAEAGRPIPDEGPALRWPPAGLDLEARAGRGAREPLLAARARAGLASLAAHALFRTGVAAAGFDPARYRRELVENTDFRKFDDGLRMTLDCTPALADQIEVRLSKAREDGSVRFGIHRQAAALMTCFVPSPTRSDHVHFVDGAAGGYAVAAQALKRDT